MNSKLQCGDHNGLTVRLNNSSSINFDFEVLLCFEFPIVICIFLRRLHLRGKKNVFRPITNGKCNFVKKPVFNSMV